MTLLGVLILGGFGALLRAALGTKLNGRIALGTLLGNVVASFALGALAGWNPASGIPHASAIAIQVGLLGALSTWSSLAHEIAEHLRSQRALEASLAIVANLVLGVLAAWLGIQIS